MERRDRFDKVFQFFYGQRLGHPTVLFLRVGLISINTKEAIFEWLTSGPSLNKKRGPVETPPFFRLQSQGLLLGREQKVNRFL